MRKRLEVHRPLNKTIKLTHAIDRLVLISTLEHTIILFNLIICLKSFWVKKEKVSGSKMNMSLREHRIVCLLVSIPRIKDIEKTRLLSFNVNPPIECEINTITFFNFIFLIWLTKFTIKYTVIR